MWLPCPDHGCPEDDPSPMEYLGSCGSVVPLMDHFGEFDTTVYSDTTVSKYTPTKSNPCGRFPLINWQLCRGLWMGL